MVFVLGVVMGEVVEVDGWWWKWWYVWLWRW